MAGARPSHDIASFDGVTIHVVELGEVHEGDRPIVLQHGFAADTELNWVVPGVAAKIAAGTHRRVLGIDARGHGSSGKPHEPKAYEDDAMAKDVSAVLDALGATGFDYVGYSMGGFIGYGLAQRDPRIRSLVLGGVGEHVLTGGPRARGAIADAMAAADASDVEDPTGKAFRAFAESTGADLEALAAMQQATRFHGDGDPTRITVPTLVIAGENDDLVGAPQPLADAIPGARCVVVPGDHLSAVVEPAFAAAIVAFLLEQGR